MSHAWGLRLTPLTSLWLSPETKLANIQNACIQSVGRQICTKKQLQSLLGLLLYISKCVHSSRIFLNQMLDTLRAHFDRDDILLDINFHRDLNWFLKFLSCFNRIAFIVMPPSKWLLNWKLVWRDKVQSVKIKCIA